MRKVWAEGQEYKFYKWVWAEKTGVFDSQADEVVMILYTSSILENLRFSGWKSRFEISSCYPVINRNLRLRNKPRQIFRSLTFLHTFCKLSSPSPDLGPDPKNRMSFAILFTLVAASFIAPLILTSGSWALRLLNLLGLLTNGSFV